MLTNNGLDIPKVQTEGVCEGRVTTDHLVKIKLISVCEKTKKGELSLLNGSYWSYGYIYFPSNWMWQLKPDLL